MEVISLSLLVPAYNEQSTLEEVTRRCIALGNKHADQFEVVICDDGSKDATWQIIQKLCERHPEVRSLRHEVNLGIGVTFEDLYQTARGDIVFMVPGDGQYPPEHIERCLPLMNEYDAVVLARTSKNYTFYRHIVSFCYRWLPRALFGVDLYDPGSVKCFKREIITSIPIVSRSAFAEAERFIRAAKRGCRIGKINIVQEQRSGGKARGAKPSFVLGSLRDMFKLWWQLSVLRRKP